MFETRQILGPSGPIAVGPITRMALACAARRALAGLCAAALLAGCGQKGPLYLPDGQTSTAPPPATSPHTQR
jgi:predicted small lipoprotein YifL